MKNTTTIATALINNLGQIEYNLLPEFKIDNLFAEVISVGQITNEAYARLPDSYPTNRHVLVQVAIEDLERTKKIKIVTNKEGDADLYSIDFWQNGERRGSGNELSLGVISGINRTVVMTTEQYLKLIDFLRK